MPAIWDRPLLERLDAARVAEVYGKLQHDVVGGGRDAAMLPAITEGALADHVDLAHQHGLKFNYLLNATCLGNVEWTADGAARIRALLDWLAAIGVDGVTVATPYLLDVVKRHYPFDVELSVRTNVDTPMKARFWQDQGVDQITIPFDSNRDFRLLRELRRAVTCRLQVVANLMCVFQCAIQHFHALAGNHASQDQGARGSAYYVHTCEADRLTDPGRYLSACWIRPEDMTVYAELGMDRLKLVDRMMTADRLGRVVDAYAAQRYEGNLLDLLYLTDRPVHLDNRKLDGFLAFFRAGKCPADCARCDYCATVARDALTVAEGYRERALVMLGRGREAALATTLAPRAG